MAEREIMTTKEAAEWLHVHPSTIYRMAKFQKIPAFRIGSDYRFDRKLLDAWVKERTLSGEQVIVRDPKQEVSTDDGRNPEDTERVEAREGEGRESASDPRAAAPGSATIRKRKAAVNW